MVGVSLTRVTNQLEATRLIIIYIAQNLLSQLTIANPAI